MEKENTNIFIISIVAIVGMIILFSGQKAVVVQGTPVNTFSENQGNNENLVGQAFKSSTICIDSDGNNKYILGEVVASGDNYYIEHYNNYGGIINGEEIIIFEDYCYDANSYTPGFEGIVEFVCVNNYGVSPVFTDCPYNCINGACIEGNSSEYFCNDTDEGINYNIAGSVEVMNDYGHEIFNDHCFYDNILIENYCAGIEAHFNEYNCSNGCSNGRCLRNNTQPYVKVNNTIQQIR